MKLYLLRHGLTEYNAKHYYQGKQDLPLSEAGRARLVRADFDMDVVYVTPLMRTAQTAEILFPTARLEVVEGLKEMDFGIFEGRSDAEMAGEPVYEAWIKSEWQLPCPEGEAWADFADRSCAAVDRLIRDAHARGAEKLVIVAHGGTQMAVLHRHALPARRLVDWLGKNGGGFVLDTSRWEREQKLELLDEVHWAP
jgi:alpha-ribazole phosphatase